MSPRRAPGCGPSSVNTRPARGQGFQKDPVPQTRIPVPGCAQQWGSPNGSPWDPVLPFYSQT